MAHGATIVVCPEKVAIDERKGARERKIKRSMSHPSTDEQAKTEQCQSSQRQGLHVHGGKPQGKQLKAIKHNKESTVSMATQKFGVLQITIARWRDGLANYSTGVGKKRSLNTGSRPYI